MNKVVNNIFSNLKIILLDLKCWQKTHFETICYLILNREKFKSTPAH